eukprot:3781521-Rhodomonas_salina.2
MSMGMMEAKATAGASAGEGEGQNLQVCLGCSEHSGGIGGETATRAAGAAQTDLAELPVPEAKCNHRDKPVSASSDPCVGALSSCRYMRALVARERGRCWSRATTPAPASPTCLTCSGSLRRPITTTCTHQQSLSLSSCCCLFASESMS